MLRLCEDQTQSLISSLAALQDASKQKDKASQIESIDFSATMDTSQLSFAMENTLGKVVCRLNKSGTLDMRIRDDGYAESNYY